MLEEYSDAFEDAVDALYPELLQKTQIHYHNTSLARLDPSLQIDAVVSPANSYGRLDGAFDDALARSFSPGPGQYEWITRKAQQVLYEKWKGYAPPGTCTLVPLVRDSGDPNPWQVRHLLLCPTMRIPWDVNWDREVVYECIWALLNVVDQHNRGVASPAEKIESVLMTPLATGCGRVSARRWAEQTVLAMKFWVEAVENPSVWGRLEWDKIFDDHLPIMKTYQRERSG